MEVGTVLAEDEVVGAMTACQGTVVLANLTTIIVPVGMTRMKLILFLQEEAMGEVDVVVEELVKGFMVRDEVMDDQTVIMDAALTKEEEKAKVLRDETEMKAITPVNVFAQMKADVVVIERQPKITSRMHTQTIQTGMVTLVTIHLVAEEIGEGGGDHIAVVEGVGAASVDVHILGMQATSSNGQQQR